MVWQGMVGTGKVWQARRGQARFGTVRFVEVWRVESRQAWKARKEMMKIEGNGRKAVFVLNQQVQSIC